MLVDVIRLRQEGERLPREAVRLAAPVRGYLWVDMRGDGSADLTTGRIAGVAYCLPSLWPVALRRIKPAGMLLVGIEHTGQLGTGPAYRQAWWCWPVCVS